MTLEEANEKLIFNDGKIVSCLMNFDNEPSIQIILNIREIVDSKIKNINVKLKFTEIISCDIFDDFKSKSYSHIKLLKLENEEFYLSLDPFDNSNIQNEKDSFVVRSKKIEIIKI